MRDETTEPRDAAVQLPGLACLEVVGSYSPWGWRPRADVGRWLPGPGKERVFDTLAAFITAHRIPVTVTRSD